MLQNNQVNAYWMMHWYTNSQSAGRGLVTSRTGQLTDWTICGLVKLPTVLF